MTGRERKAYPTFPASCWWPLRERLKRSLPPAITAEYLQAVLEVEPKTARNLVPMLRQMGLVDDAGAPRERANSWRVDAEYRQVCHAIRDELYPAALRYAVPDPTSDFDAAVRWFMKNSGVGTAAARRMARFYTLLSKADPAELRGRADRRAGTSLRQPTSRATAERRSDGSASRRNAGPAPGDASRDAGTSNGLLGDSAKRNGAHTNGAGGHRNGLSSDPALDARGNSGRDDEAVGDGPNDVRTEGSSADLPESPGSAQPPVGAEAVTPEGITFRPLDLPPAPGTTGPPVQLVVQIQLPPGATAEQIDQLVASIARHLAPHLARPREDRR